MEKGQYERTKAHILGNNSPQFVRSESSRGAEHSRITMGICVLTSCFTAPPSTSRNHCRLNIEFESLAKLYTWLGCPPLLAGPPYVRTRQDPKQGVA
eukprot:5053328-Pyramimonas_sp.AAC.1